MKTVTEKEWDASKENDAPLESTKKAEPSLSWPTSTKSVSFKTVAQYRKQEELDKMNEEQKSLDNPTHYENAPLAAGEMIDLSMLHEDDFYGKEKIIVDTVRKYGGLLDQKPLIGIDLAYMKDLGLIVNGKSWDELMALPEVQNSQKFEQDNKICAKIIVPAEQICSLTYINPKAGKSIVKVNHAFPAYRWFHAANLQLRYKGLPGRLIPFPIEQNDGTVTYQMLKVNMKEYNEYQSLIKQGTNIGHNTETIFHNSAKYAYHVLKEYRGHDKISHGTVDKEITNVIFKQHSYIRGVLLLNAQKEDLEDHQDAHYIYYA